MKMKLKPWQLMPTAWIQAGVLEKFQWREDGSAGTAALMIYFVLCQLASERPLRPSENHEPEEETAPQPEALRPASTYNEFSKHLEGVVPPWKGSTQPVDGAVSMSNSAASISVVPNPAILQVPGGWGVTAAANAPDVKTEVIEEDNPLTLAVRATYDDLADLTGLSRDRVHAGLKKLIAVKMIWRVDRSSTYGLSGYGSGKRWAKLPGKVLLSPAGTSFLPFSHFHLRSRTELNALKLHLYYASTRERNALYSEVAYPMIHRRTGIPERDIPPANSFLLSCGILARTRGLPSEDIKQHESNKYYLTGYEHFLAKKKAA